MVRGGTLVESADGWTVRLALAILSWTTLSGSSEPVVLCPRPLAGGLRHPTDLLALADGQLLVSEQPGRIMQLSGQNRWTVLDLGQKVLTSDTPYEERGLLSFALDLVNQPDRIYVCYCARTAQRDMDHELVVARFHLVATGDHKFQADVNSEFRLLTIGQPGARRNGGYLFFGPPDASLLYVTVGSGGGGEDEDRTRFDANSLLGKVLRVNVSDPSSSNYTIPEGNPFPSSAAPDGRREILALGFWNPWRCTVDPHQGSMKSRVLCGDVGAGPNNTDLVVMVVPGGVYGCPPDCSDWPRITVVNQTGKTVHPQRALYAHRHEIGQALIGGPIYRGSRIPALQGAYLFGDFVHGSLHALREREPEEPWSKTDIQLDTSVLSSKYYILSIATDQAGEPLMLAASELKSSSASGSVYSLWEDCPGGVPRAAAAHDPVTLITAVICTYLILGRQGYH